MELLSEEWLAEQQGRSVAADDPEATGLLQYEITGAAGGKQHYWIRIDAGVVTEAGSGQASGDPDISFIVAASDAKLLDQNELEPAVAYMQGRLKADGNMKLLFTLLAAAHTASA